MAKKAKQSGPFPVLEGDFTIEHRPKATRKGGGRSQEVNIVMKKYKGNPIDKRISLWEGEYNDIMSCKEASGFPEKTKEGKSCNPPSCNVITKGTYKVGGKTESNPVVLNFDSGESILLDIVGVKMNPKTCDQLDKFKIK